MDTYRIEWKDTLSINNEEVDAQHKELIERIRGLPEDTSSQDTPLLDQVLQYAEIHFRDEEAFMESIQYPALKEHAREHKRLVRTLHAYKKEYDAGQHDLYDFKQFMYRWVRDHIMDIDHQIGDFLRTQ